MFCRVKLIWYLKSFIKNEHWFANAQHLTFSASENHKKLVINKTNKQTKTTKLGRHTYSEGNRTIECHILAVGQFLGLLFSDLFCARIVWFTEQVRGSKYAIWIHWNMILIRLNNDIRYYHVIARNGQSMDSIIIMISSHNL